MVTETLSHYRILEKLGAGAMGEVYLARDTKLDRTVALKILPAEFADNPERLERFVREAKAASPTASSVGRSPATCFRTAMRRASRN